MSVIQGRALRKQYTDVAALDGFDLEVQPGRIVGLIGPNGSGKTTALNAILGLNTLDSGELTVLGKNPRRQRAALMHEIAYIADTGILPRWMRVCDLLDYVAGVHPKFNRQAADARLAQTEIRLNKPVRALSKGMHVQLHLAIILAIDAQLMVLDEPTLGLDILYRQYFYDAILNEYFDATKSILITTHEVREIEHILTDVVFIHRGAARLSLSMDEVADRFVKLTASEAHGETRAQTVPAGWLSQRQTLAGTEYIFENVAADELAPLGELATPNIAELFVAVVEG